MYCIFYVLIVHIWEQKVEDPTNQKCKKEDLKIKVFAVRRKLKPSRIRDRMKGIGGG